MVIREEELEPLRSAKRIFGLPMAGEILSEKLLQQRAAARAGNEDLWVEILRKVDHLEEWLRLGLIYRSDEMDIVMFTLRVEGVLRQLFGKDVEIDGEARNNCVKLVAYFIPERRKQLALQVIGQMSHQYRVKRPLEVRILNKIQSKLHRNRTDTEELPALKEIHIDDERYRGPHRRPPRR